MRDQIMYYPLIGSGKFGVERHALNGSPNKDGTFRCSNYCLSSLMPGMYRLLSKNKANLNEVNHFHIKCPTCGAKLERLSDSIDEHTLQIYGCKYCH